MTMLRHKLALATVGLTIVLSSPIAARADDVLSESSYVRRNADFDQAALSFLRGEQPKIVGGRPAAPGAYPWQVSLAIAWIADPAQAHFCGGSIYADRWIVTAAHCVTNLKAAEVNVVAGTNVLMPGVRRVNVRRVVIEKHYVAEPHPNNDVALLELRTPLPLGTSMQAISLPDADDLPAKQLLTVTGWGATSEGGVLAKQLQETEVPFVSNQDCNDPLSYKGDITDAMMCAGRATGGQDACQGDSGGPLVLSRGPGNGILEGIVSWGEGCARPGRYGVYTKVSRFADWIRKCAIDPVRCQS